VTLTDRDRKILIAVIPVLAIVAYWFLLLGPKRDDAKSASDALTVQQERLDTARTKADAASGAKAKFQTTYAQVVRLGKAIPTEVDMPSLLVQLDKAAEGTNIRFTKIKTGARTSGVAAATTGTTTAPAPAAGSESGTNGSPVAAGGQTAQSAPGGAVEAANNAQQTSNQASSAAENSGVSPSDTQTSTTAGATDTSGQTGTTPVGLDTVPLELEFDGDFFNLAGFFHDVKRFVSTASNNVAVSGRLITIEGVRWSSDEELFPKIKAEITATIYLAPKTQGATAGATPTGPSTTTPTSTPDQSTPASTPTATATP
jgi:Tfp pilus assembly protein PilO